jgi:deferrochelatase/peroxidase EfeB
VFSSNLETAKAATDQSGAEPFFGRHQSGITTPAQDALCFAALDLATQNLQGHRDLFRIWSKAASKMMAGLPAVSARAEESVPVDTGDAVGLAPARLTITFGLGPSIFEHQGADRFGLGHLMPAALRPLPAFSRDRLDPAHSDGDVCIQACSDDPQVAFHAVHTLMHMAETSAAPRWIQLGFGRTSSTTAGQSTPRNLMGFKDGTKNLRAEDAASMASYVWAGTESPAWMRTGTYMVCRRIQMLLTTWDGSELREQEHTFGRRKAGGAPLTGTSEYDPVDLNAKGPDGKPVIPLDAHIRVAGPVNNDDTRLLRRGYSYATGMDPQTGLIDAGLFFVCFQRDPRSQFVRIQRQLDAHDHLNRYIVHTASALFAVPPGAKPGSYVGAGLFGL